MKILGTVRALDDGRGAVRVEDVYETDVDDLWEACTTPERLARWIAEVSGDLSPGGAFRARFTSGWEGTGRVETCEPPRHLVVVTTQAGELAEAVIEATLTADGPRARLVIEERGVPIEQVADYGAGWQVHLEDLGAHLDGRERCRIETRWAELVSDYRAMEAR
jgi:uncharacterized protein YndB with AHSA1/START domain